jgi:hypothetical protein
VKTDFIKTEDLDQHQKSLCSGGLSLMTEEELIEFLRIPEISKAKNHGYVIENLRRMHDLPCVHICRQPLYPLKSVLEWLDQQVEKEKAR